MKNLAILAALLLGLSIATVSEIRHNQRNIPNTPQAVIYAPSIDNQQYDCDRISHDIVNPTVQLISDDGGGGTGVVIKELGKSSRILTAYHVVKGAKSIRAQQTIGNATSFAWGLEILIFDEEKDLAILSCNRTWAGVAEIITDHRQLRRFVPAFTYGYPGGRLGLLDGVLSHGFVSNTAEEHWKDGVLTTTSVTVALGNSGGGLFVFIEGKWRVAGTLSVVLTQPMMRSWQMVNSVSGFVTAKDMLEFIARLK